MERFDTEVTATINARLRRRLGAPLTVRVTNNARTMLSVRRVEGVRHVRLHSMFVDAPDEVIDAVARYLAHGDRAAGRHIDRYIREHAHRIERPRRAPVAPATPVGQTHDLGAILAELITRYCPEATPVQAVWGRQRSSARRGRHRSIRMGVYLYDEGVIRIHPALDAPWVPRYFVAWVLYHELLHHVVPATERDGRLWHHGEEFRRREGMFAERDAALAWERDNVHQLIATRDG